MAKDPWDEEPEVDPWDKPAPAPKTYGPVNPRMSSVANSPEEMAQNARMASDAGIPVANATPPAFKSKNDYQRTLAAGGAIPFEESAQAGAESDIDLALNAIKQGGKQGLTAGFADELEGFSATGSFSGDAYEKARDASRARDDEAAFKSPKAHMLGLGMSGLAMGAAMPAMSLPATVAVGAGVGALGGIGESRGETFKDVAIDGAIGAGIGGVTAGMLSKLTGANIKSAGARTDARLVDDFGLRATKTQRNNIALIGKRAANETPEMAAVADEVDDAMAMAMAEVDNITPGSPPMSSKKAAKEGAAQALKTKEEIQKAIGDLARKTGLDPFAAKPTELVGAAERIIQDKGARIGFIDKAVEEATGGIPIADVKRELQTIIDKYAKKPGAVASGRRENAKSLISQFDEFYPSSPVSADGAFVAPPVGGPRIAVPELRASKKLISDSAFTGNAAANPSIAKEGEQELAAAMNAVLKKHIKSSAKINPDLEALVSELPELNKQFGFAKAIKAAADYRAMGEVNSPTGFRDIASETTLLGAARKLKTVTSDAAGIKRDKVLASLARTAESSDSKLKRTGAKAALTAVKATPMAGNRTAVSETFNNVLYNRGGGQTPQPFDEKYQTAEDANASWPYEGQ